MGSVWKRKGIGEKERESEENGTSEVGEGCGYKCELCQQDTRGEEGAGGEGGGESGASTKGERGEGVGDGGGEGERVGLKL